MKSLYAALLLAVAGLGGSASGAFADPVYMIAQVQIENHDAYFGSYGAKVGPLLQDAGAKILVATPQTQQLEGAWTGNWTVVIEFPSLEAANGWYYSDSYQKDVRPLRLKTTSSGNLILAPAFKGL